MPITFSNSGITFNDSSVQATAFSGYTLLRNERLNTGTLYTTSVSASSSPLALQFQYYGAQGGNTSVTVRFRWGLGGLTSEWYPHNGRGVNFVVCADPSLITYISSPTANTLHMQCDQTNLGTGSWFCTLIQL